MRSMMIGANMMVGNSRGFSPSMIKPFTAWAWKFANVIEPIAAFDGPFPMQVTVPGLHEAGEVLKLPLRKSVSAFGRDDYGWYDYGDSTTKTSRVPYQLSTIGSPLVSSEGTYFDGSSGLNLTFPINFSDGFAIAFEFKTAHQDGQSVMGAVTDASPYFTIALSNTSVALRNWNEDYKYFSFSSGLYHDNEWHTFLASFASGGSPSVWIDGTPLTPVAGSWLLSSVGCAGTFRIGGSREGGFTGSLRNVVFQKGTIESAGSTFYLPQDLYQYNPAVVLNLPLTGHTTDLGDGVAKEAPSTAHVVTVTGATVDADGALFDANGELIDLTGNVDDFKWDGDVSISFKVKLDSLVTDGVILCSASVSAPGFFRLMHDQSTTGWRIAVSSSYTFSDPSVTTGVWYSILLKRTSGVWELLRDGVSRGTLEDASTPETGTSGLRIGKNYDALTEGVRGTIKDLLILKGTSTAPASTYQYAGQDLRIAKNNVEVPMQLPLRGFNPISGQVDVWVDGTVDAVNETPYEFYIGNASAESASQTLTYPAGYPADPTTATYPDDYDLGQLTDDQEAVLAASINDPTNFQTVGSLEAN